MSYTDNDWEAAPFTFYIFGEAIQCIGIKYYHNKSLRITQRKFSWETRTANRMEKFNKRKSKAI